MCFSSMYSNTRAWVTIMHPAHLWIFHLWTPILNFTPNARRLTLGQPNPEISLDKNKQQSAELCSFSRSFSPIPHRSERTSSSNFGVILSNSTKGKNLPSWEVEKQQLVPKEIQGTLQSKLLSAAPAHRDTIWPYLTLNCLNRENQDDSMNFFICRVSKTKLVLPNFTIASFQWTMSQLHKKGQMAFHYVKSSNDFFNV